MKQSTPHDNWLERARTGVQGARRAAFAKCSWSAAVALVMVSLLGCAGNDSEDVVLRSTVMPDGTVILSSPTAPGPNDPLTPFEQRRVIARIQQDPQRQLQRLSPRERNWLAGVAAAARQENEER